MAWVLANSQSEGHDRLVLLAIANHCDAFGRNSWPSVGQIADEARVHRATVFRAISVLQQLGEIEVISGSGRGRTNHYRVPIERVAGCDPSTETKGSQAATGGVAKTPLKGRTGATQTVSNRQRTVARTHARPTAGVQDWEPTGDLEPLHSEEKTKGLEHIRQLKGRAS